MKCFVIMPFGNVLLDEKYARKQESIYSDWIKPAVEAIKDNDQNNLICHRADKKLRPEEIITHIVENLVTSDIVIADLTGKNANVFYELGVRHAIGNNTILIAENLDDIPFDLRGLMTIVYGYEPESMIGLKKKLTQSILEILEAPEKIDNPVRRYLFNSGFIEKDSSLRSESQNEVVSEVSSLRKVVEDQAEDLRNFMKLLTSITEDRVVTTTSIDLEFFAGVWKEKDTDNTFCAKIVDSVLFFPYSYFSADMLTAHLYNLTLIGDTLFGRFEWFHANDRGYIYLRRESEDVIEGGWIYSENVPPDARKDISLISNLKKGMVDITLIRDAENKVYPEWANYYFDNNGYYKPE